MTAVLRSPTQIPSPSSSPLSCNPSDGGRGLLRRRRFEDGVERKEESKGQEDQLSLLTFVLTVLRKSLAGCRTEGGDEELRSMEIGWPTNVRHVAHVTFDRFHGFLGLPVEFEPEVPRRVPSASTNVFGVSTQSMQCSYDSRGNSVPTILLLMQQRLYEQGGLQAEGIFRINAENSQEEYVRDQLNNGVVPHGIDVHCLAGLIKAWFRELPTAVLDCLTPEQVAQCQSEDECAQLVKLLPPSEAALLDWAINLMADVVQEEQQNKMNARNVAMVFAPNMTQMADPLTALMYAVQVMNFLKMLILKTLKDRQEPFLENDASVPHPDPSGGNSHHSLCLPMISYNVEDTEHVFAPKEPVLDSPTHLNRVSFAAEGSIDNSQTSSENAVSQTTSQSNDECSCEVSVPSDNPTKGSGHRMNSQRKKGQPRSVNNKKGTRKMNSQPAVRGMPAEKAMGMSVMSSINSKVKRIEAWR